MFSRPIAISLSPNTQPDDIRVAFRSLLDIFHWKRGESEKKTEIFLKNYFKTAKVYLFNSGRSALFCLLKSLNIGVGDEVIIQGFTCVAVADPILWSGARPIFAEIDDSLNLNPELLERYITSKTKAIIVQHTFGTPAKFDQIKKIAQKHNLYLIEDCAHSIGATYKGRKVGSLSDAAFFSFGRDKVISSVFGGALIINNPKKVSTKRLDEIYEQLPYPSKFWIFQQLLHPLSFLLILPLYNIYLGKILLFLLLKLRLLIKPVEETELTGGRPVFFPQRLPNALARLAENQLQKLDRFNIHRRHIAGIYFRELKSLKGVKLPVKIPGSIYMRYNITTSQRDDLFRFLRTNKILPGNWYHHVIDPQNVDYNKIFYTPGSLPQAEKAARLSLNLPTYPGLPESCAFTIIKLLKAYENNRNKG